VRGKPVGRLHRLVARPDFIKGDPKDLVHLDWSHAALSGATLLTKDRSIRRNYRHAVWD